MDSNSLFKPSSNVYRRKSVAAPEEGSAAAQTLTQAALSPPIVTDTADRGGNVYPSFISEPVPSTEVDKVRRSQGDCRNSAAKTIFSAEFSEQHSLAECEDHSESCSDKMKDKEQEKQEYKEEEQDMTMNGSASSSTSDLCVADPPDETDDSSPLRNVLPFSTKEIGTEDRVQQVPPPLLSHFPENRERENREQAITTAVEKAVAMATASNAVALKQIAMEKEDLNETISQLRRALAEKNQVIDALHEENSALEAKVVNNASAATVKEEEVKDEVISMSMESAVYAVEQAHCKRRSQLQPPQPQQLPAAEMYPAFADPPTATCGQHKIRVLRVGLICFGLSGRVFHAPFLLTHPGFCLTAVFERGEKTLASQWVQQQQQQGDRHRFPSGGIKTCRRVEDLVARPDVDLVVVCSPIALHFKHAQLALQAGKHVLVEKAFTTTATEAVELFRLARERGLVCVPFQNRRFDSDFRTLQRCLPQVGRIAEFHGYFNRFMPSVRSTWKDQDVDSGGNFLSLGSHMIDQAICLFGAPSAVWADVRAHRSGSAVDDAWEVHLFYDEDWQERKQQEYLRGKQKVEEDQLQQRMRQPQTGNKIAKNSPSPKRVPPKVPTVHRPPPRTPPAPSFSSVSASSSASLSSSVLSSLPSSSLAKVTSRAALSITLPPPAGKYLITKHDVGETIHNNVSTVSNVIHDDVSCSVTATEKVIDTVAASKDRPQQHADTPTHPPHLHRGGFRAVLKGSLLCADHALRYMVHGSNGSWRKEGMDPQEAQLMTGYVPPYPSTYSDALSGKPLVNFHGYGVERKQQWGVFTAADGSSNTTLPELGSYFMLYDQLHAAIEQGGEPPVTAADAVLVLRVLELAKKSSQERRVLDFCHK